MEGNYLEWLPGCMLKMSNHIEQINVKNNYLHPLIWKNTIINSPPVN
jgi:hypothetical protein